MTSRSHLASSLFPTSLAAIVAVVAASAAACGGDETTCACPAIEKPDAASTIDASPDGGPQQLDSADGITIEGVTDNGLIIYTIPNDGVWSVPFTSDTVPTRLSPPHDPTVDAAADAWSAIVAHHIVVMSSNAPSSGSSSPTAGTRVLVWDERTGASTPFFPPSLVYEAFAGAIVSPDSQAIVTTWQNSSASATQWFVSKIDGAESVAFGPPSAVSFDGEWLVYLAPVGTNVGTPSASLMALDGANGWASTTLSTNASGFALDTTGSRALVSTGPFPNGGNGIVLAPLDGGAATVLDPTGGGPMVYLSPDSTFAMYTAEEGTPSAHVVAVALPISGPPGVPYAVPGDHLETTAGGNLEYFGGNVDVAMNAPGGPAALITSMSAPAIPPLQAIVGVGAGATTPDVALPVAFGDGFTSDGSYVVVNRPAPGVQNGSMVALSAFALPSGPESAPLATSSTGWLAIGGSKILFTDDYQQGPLALRVADLSKGAASTLVVADVATYFISPDGTKVAFTHPSQTSPLGLWITTLPTDL